MNDGIRLVVTLAFVCVTAGVRAGEDEQVPPKPPPKKSPASAPRSEATAPPAVTPSVTIAPSPAPATAPLPGTPTSAPAPKAARPSPEGTYVVEGGTAEVRVKRISGDFLYVSSSDGWEGVGVLDGPMYRGVFRDRAIPDAPPPALGEMTIDWARPDNPEMKATYTIRARSQFAQRWRRSDVLNMPSEEPPAPPAPGRRPAFGDYVYVEELPEALTKVPPPYPEDARRERVQGVVLVQALIIEDGTVADCRIVNSIPLLDEAAIASVRQWRFKPARAAGKPVAVWVAVPVRFSLQ